MKHKTTGAKLGKNSVSGMMFALRHKCQSDFGGSRSLLAKLVWLRVSVASITRNFVLFSCTNSQRWCSTAKVSKQPDLFRNLINVQFYTLFPPFRNHWWALQWLALTSSNYSQIAVFSALNRTFSTANEKRKTKTINEIAGKWKAKEAIVRRIFQLLFPKVCCIFPLKIKTNVVKWQLNWAKCNFGLRSASLTFQIELALCAHSFLKPHLWFQIKSTPLNAITITECY